MNRIGAIRRILSWIVATWPRRSKRRNFVEEAHAFFAERLTDSGKMLGFLWLGSLPVAMIPGTTGWLVFVLLSAALGVGLVATLRPPRLEVEYLGCGGAVAGGRVELRLRVANRSKRRIGWAGVGLYRAFEGLERRDVFQHVPDLDPGESKDLTLSVECRSRGPTGFPGFGAIRSDVFGLTRARRIVFSPVDIEVAPEPIRIVPSSFLFGGPSGRAFLEAAGLGGDGERIFQGVREFREGDRIRDLDHKAWARWNAPVVREFAAAGAGGIALHVQTGADGLLERSFVEPMLRLACGIAVEFCRRGWLGGLWLDGMAVSVRLDSPEDIERVFAEIPRCGWGKWPTPGGDTATPARGMPLVSIGVSTGKVVTENDQHRGPSKRILVGGGKAEAIDVARVLRVEASEIESGEVVL